MIGLYHVVLFSFRRKEPLPLVFALVCAVFALRGVFEGERLILMMFDLPFELYGKLWFILYYVLAPVVMLFLHYLFPRESWPWLLKTVLSVMAAFCLATLVLPLSAAIRIMPFFHPITLVSMLYAVRVLALAILHDRPGSRVFTLGMAILIATGIHDLLYTENIIESTYLAPAGLLAFVFSQAYFIAARFSNSLTRVQGLSEQLRAYSLELEDKVALRTRELEQRNRAIMESIEYAQLIQSSVLPSPAELQELIPHHFVIWRPRDLVGGDFYWSRALGKSRGWIAVGDCTGHGVPGALMAMMATSLLNREAHLLEPDNPAAFLHELNLAVRESLHQDMHDGKAHEGFDMILAYLEPGRLTAAGAHLGLYTLQDDGPAYFPGSRKGIGYVEPSSDFRYENFSIALQPGDHVYMMSDGLLDQSGGEKGFAFGRRRLLKLLEELHQHPFAEHSQRLDQAVKEYANGEAQRDDIVVVGFSTETG